MVSQNVGGRDRIVRGVLAVVFAVIAIKAIRGGNRNRGVFAGVVAVGFALNTVTCFCTFNKLVGLDTTSEN